VISSIFLVVLGFGAVALLVTGALAPIETLSWWAGWTESEIADEDAPVPVQENADRLYIVYLSGVASISGRFLIPREKAFIKNLKARFPKAKVISDVFPYSPSGLPLLESPRLFDRLWRWVQYLKLEGRTALLAILINMRNIFQVMISADHRYGPIFNQGAAKVIEGALTRAGYARGSGAPVVIIGYSGGAQIAIGASTFLRSRLNAPIDVISIGGVMGSDPGLQFIRRLDHIVGERDTVERFGAAMYPERWKAMAHSDWNAAKRHGRVVLHRMRNMAHAGVKGYFGRVKVDGVSNNDRTLDEVAAILAPDAPQATPPA